MSTLKAICGNCNGKPLPDHAICQSCNGTGFVEQFVVLNHAGSPKYPTCEQVETRAKAQVNLEYFRVAEIK